MLSTLTKSIEDKLQSIILSKYGIAYDTLPFTTPPRIELGELALPIAFDLARKIRRPPREIARELAGEASAIPGVWRVDVAGGGYLNFYPGPGCSKGKCDSQPRPASNTRHRCLWPATPASVPPWAIP